jgi:hypothetical protein
MRVVLKPLLFFFLVCEYRRDGQDNLPNLGERHEEAFLDQNTRIVNIRTIFQQSQGESDHLAGPPSLTKPSA